MAEAKTSATKLAQLIETAKGLGIEKEEVKLKQVEMLIAHEIETLPRPH